MATVNKNFVIKNGLVVQGSTATINGNSILTQNAGDAYILNLVGGATLVKSVDSVFTVDQAGNLTLNYGTGLTKTSNNLVIDRSTVDTWYDAAGSAASAQSAAESYADSQISSAITTLGNQTSTDIQDAITTAENYTDSAISSLGNSVSDTYIPDSEKGQANGVATLDSNSFIPSGQIDPSYWATKDLVRATATNVVIAPNVDVATTSNLPRPVMAQPSYQNIRSLLPSQVTSKSLACGRRVSVLGRRRYCTQSRFFKILRYSEPAQYAPMHIPRYFPPFRKNFLMLDLLVLKHMSKVEASPIPPGTAMISTSSKKSSSTSCLVKILKV